MHGILYAYTMLLTSKLFVSCLCYVYMQIPFKKILIDKRGEGKQKREEESRFLLYFKNLRIR